MCNCGNKREAFSNQPSYRLSNQDKITQQGSRMWPDANFEYIGKTALSVKGNVSGKNYRFSKPGDVQPVDYRDASSLMAVPVLKKLK